MSKKIRDFFRGYASHGDTKNRKFFIGLIASRLGLRLRRGLVDGGGR